MWTIFVVQLIGLISPGPDFFYVCRQAMAHSRRSAMLGTLGITIGIGFWALMVLFGLAFINRYFPHFQHILMILGGGYLAYSGIKMVQVTQSAVIDENPSQVVKQRSAYKEILSGLAINLANPKIVIFFSSVLSGYIANLEKLSDILGVLAILMGSGLIYFWLVAILFSQRKIRQFYTKHNRYLDNFAGAVFILFGATLSYEGILSFF